MTANKYMLKKLTDSLVKKPIIYMNNNSLLKDLYANQLHSYTFAAVKI
jgi:hypothetical protein